MQILSRESPLPSTGDPKLNDEMEKYIKVWQESQNKEDKSSHVGCLSACLI